MVNGALRPLQLARVIEHLVVGHGRTSSSIPGQLGGTRLSMLPLRANPA
jgi:hypothetical protein